MPGTRVGYCVLALLPRFSPLRSPTDMSIRFPEVVLAPSTPLPCFYPHSQWAALGPVQVGVRSQAQVHHHGDGPGLLGAAILRAIFKGSKLPNAVTRTRRWISLLTKTSRGLVAFAPSTHVGSAPSSGFPNVALNLNGSALVAYFLTLAGYAASAVGAPWRSGSYTSPLIHSRCNNTANFRATATAAVGSRTGAVPRRFLLGLYPRFPSSCPFRSCRRPVSSPRHLAPSVQISRTRRSCLLLVKLYETYRARATFRPGLSTVPGSR